MPFNIGLGSITAVDKSVQDLSPRDNVLLFSKDRCSEIAIDASCLFKIDPSIQLPVSPYISAWALLNDFKALKEGDLVVQSHGSSSIGKAVSLLGSEMGLKVFSPTSEQLFAPNFAEKVKELGKVELAIAGKGDRAVRSLIRILPHSGTLVLNSERSNSLSDLLNVAVPMSSLIFDDFHMAGFDFFFWAKNNRDLVVKAIEATSVLMKQNRS